MLLKQISIFIENRTGRLAEVTNIIAQNGIDIRALSVADTAHFGILRIIVHDPYKVEQILKDNGLTFSLTSVVTVQVKDEPGGLAGLLGVLTEHDISIEYMYAFLARNDNKAYVVMRVEEDLKAQAILKENGYIGIEAGKL